MPQAIKRKILNFFSQIKPVVKIGLILAFILLILQILISIDTTLKKNNITRELVKSLVFDTQPPINKFQGRTNIAVLGIVGGSHDGADLTDTVIFLSIDFQKQDAVIMSVPRDIWMDSLKDKINSAYHYGEKKQTGGGLVLAKSMVEEVVGQPVHFALLVDLSNFEKIIDLVGGIDINVEQSFTDNFYPIPGKENDLCEGDLTFACRYEKLVFTKGLLHMNGDLASKYVRSRQAEGDEGTDFARSRRQQKVIVALKDKVFQSSLWKNPKVVKALVETVNNSITTDMSLSEKLILGKFVTKIKDSSVRKVVLDDGNEQKQIKGFLKNPPAWEYKGAWVLLPRTGNFDEIHKFVSCKLQDPMCTMTP